MTGGVIASAATAPKVEPESLELRARPRPAVRFRKGLVVGLAGGSAAMIALVGWFALDVPSFRLAPGPAAREHRDNSADALEDVPKSYDEVPLLGPPLPGDLGRPILKHRATGAGRGSASPERDRRNAEEERLVAARSSSLMVTLAARPLADPGRPIEQDREEVPAGRSSHRGDVAETQAGTAALSAGAIIPASLITGINSDLPGIVLAQVTEPVRDSATGQLVLIPQGARLIGEYDSKIAYGQRRAGLSWNRLVFPDGRSIDLDKLPAADRTGYSGLEDEVDFHGWRLLKGVALSTALGIGAELGLGTGDQGLIGALGDSAQLATARAGDEITRRNLDVKPTIKVRPGWPIRLILHRDLRLDPWKG